MRIVPVLLAACLLLVPTAVSAENSSFTKAGWIIHSGCSIGVGTLTLDGDEVRFEAISPCLPVGYAVSWSLSDDCNNPTTTEEFYCGVSESGLWYTLRVGDPEYDGDPDTVLVVHSVIDGGASQDGIFGTSFRDVPV